MKNIISIPAYENGVVRVFSLSMSREQACELKANDAGADAARPLELALGCDALNNDHVEVFAVSDLGEMSLADYLIEGADVQREALEPHRLKLAALEGWVMIVYSSAFMDKAVDLAPNASLTLIGSYLQEDIDWVAPTHLSAESARPQPFDEPSPEQKKRPSDAAMSGRIAMIALLVAFGVVGLMIWVGS